MAKWSTDLRLIAKAIEGDLDKVSRAVAFELFVRVVWKTPVGDAAFWSSPAPPGYVGGRLRGNWQISLDKGYLPPTDDIDPSGNTTIGNASSVVGNIKIGQVVKIQNNLPYAVAIEFGHSRIQQPEGMVRITAAEFPDIVREKAAAVRALPSKV